MHKEIADYLNRKLPAAEAKVNEVENGDASITVKADQILSVCRSLKDSEFEFNVLQCISGVDFLPSEEKEGRIEVNYILASFTKNHELILKIEVPRGDKDNLPKVDSVTSVWTAADWQEREAYDLIGIEFVGHPDHRRILCPYDWEGHPLRKDYVVQEKYLDMVVNPPAKMNFEDRAFGVRQKAIPGGATSVQNYSLPDETEKQQG